MIKKLFSLFVVVISLLFSFSHQANAEHFKVYLLGGQSNAAGKALISGLPSDLQAAQTNVRIFHGDNSGVGTWQHVAPGISQEGPQYFGPEITFGRDLANANPTDNIAIIKYALGGTTLHTKWDPNTPGAQYAAFSSTIANALKALTVAGDTYQVAGMIWMQGESDGWPKQSTLAQAKAYESNLTNFIAKVRADLDIANLPLVIGKIFDTPVWKYGTYIRSAQEAVNTSVANTGLVDTDDLSLGDPRHYDTASMMSLGSRFATTILSLDNTP